MANDEAQMTNDERTTNDEDQSPNDERLLGDSAVMSASSFVI
jgi:hypothetical protein